jgi:hypothetical protein
MRSPLILVTVFALLCLTACSDSSDSEEHTKTDAEFSSAAMSGNASENGIIGSWLDNVSNPLFGSTLTIFVEDGRYFLETKFDDGSVRKTALVEKESPLGRRFDMDPESNVFQMKDYWVIDKNGDLLLQNELDAGTGLKARRIK